MQLLPSKEFVLAIDTSGSPVGQSVSAAIFRSDGTFLECGSRTQGAEELIELLSSFETWRQHQADIGLIVVGQGPGSFTGLRIGISLAQGIALGMSVPLVAVPLLDAWGYECASRQTAHWNDPFVVGVEASATEVFQQHVQLHAREVISPLSEIESCLRKALNPDCLVLPDSENRATLVGKLGVERLQRGTYTTELSWSAVIAPLYGKPVNAKTRAERLGQTGQT